MNWYKHATVVGLIAICILCGAAQSNAPEDKETKDLKEKIKQIKKKNDALEDDIVIKANHLKQTLSKLTQTEEHLRGLNSLGRIEQMQLKAELYGVEKQSRERIAVEVDKLLESIQSWRTFKQELKEKNAILKLREQIAKLKEQNKDQSLVKLNSVTDYEKYRVQKDASLREISALPDVYGSPNKAVILFDANKDIIKDPTAKVPAGTVLKVPLEFKGQMQEEEFSELEGK